MRVRPDALALVGHSPVVRRLYDHPRLAALARAAVNHVVPEYPVQVRVARGSLRGVHLSLNLRREKAFWLGTYEPDVQRILCERLRRGGIAWDVGAFIGYHTLLMCRMCGSSNVVAVEPDPVNVGRLWGNLRLNLFHDANVVSGALGSHIGRGILRRGSLDRRQNVVEEVDGRGTGEFGSSDIRVETLDSMLETYGPPDLIKADVEGAEDLMLQGAARLLDEVKPFLILEVHGLGGQNAIKLLKENGYRVKYLDNGFEAGVDLPVGQRHVIGEPWR